MAQLSKEMAGTVTAVPGQEIARFNSKAAFCYQPTATSAIELATRRVEIDFGFPPAMSRTVAELAGMGGRL